MSDDDAQAERVESASKMMKLKRVPCCNQTAVRRKMHLFKSQIKALRAEPIQFIRSAKGMVARTAQHC